MIDIIFSVLLLATGASLGKWAVYHGLPMPLAMMATVVGFIIFYAGFWIFVTGPLGWAT